MKDKTEFNKELISIRSDYISRVKNELMGPGSENVTTDKEYEIISTSPINRYSIGILFPKESKMNKDNDETEIETETSSDENSEVMEKNGIQLNLARKHLSEAGQNDDNNDNPMDEQVCMASQNKPSSMGLSFLINENTSKIIVDISYGTYKKCDLEFAIYTVDAKRAGSFVLPETLKEYAAYDAETSVLHLTKMFEKSLIKPFKDTEPYVYSIMDKLLTIAETGYHRIPLEERITLDFGSLEYAEESLKKFNLKMSALKKKVNDSYSVTVMLVNENVKETPEKTVFQPVISVNSEVNGITFVDYSSNLVFDLLDDEEKSLELLYRNKKVYASGLGVSCSWDIDEKGQGSVFTNFFPEAEVPAMDFDKRSINGKVYDRKVLSMKYLSDLSDAPKTEKIDELYKFVDVYSEWIMNIEKESNQLEVKYRGIAQKNIVHCKKSLGRMKKGIDLLGSNSEAWNAFMLANRAMFMQRVHIKIQADTSNTDRYPDDQELSTILKNIDYFKNSAFSVDEYFWRPFQLAFLLMSVESTIDSDSPDRNEVDLIWFPTGGGKTEAYLGLTAMTIFYRRMVYDDDVSDGTTVIMRYTLRLLAAQQFMRAATLICACEYIRKENQRTKKYNIGSKEITIGLWIGGSHTPNRNFGRVESDDIQAKEMLDKLFESTEYTLEANLDKYNKFQLIKCPWCGTKLAMGITKVNGKLKKVGRFGYEVTSNRGTKLRCTQSSCPFGGFNYLPVRIVDEDLYKYPPTLLFGTVDKFALMPWKAEVGAFFGVNRKSKSPDLIIQDELHLISGPLGTIVGLYESVIDKLCENAKIIASTATIRRASEQCAALYNRTVNQFPAPGIDENDSYFAFQKTIDYEIGAFGRKYVGLMPYGRTKATMEIRTVSALAQIISEMPLNDEQMDKFWTLTMYFNSLRDLGKCTTLIEDDIFAYMYSMATRDCERKRQRFFKSVDLLSSRVNTTDLNRTLDRLEKNDYSEEALQSGRYPSDIALATNMISVGLDVARLNAMLLVGQPKLTSEYIQASSRVGRTYPGVAFVMYDGTKSRDRSYYEQFKSFHNSFYKHVEPTGATPFSKPACDRALHAVLITLLRYENKDLFVQDSKTGAHKFRKEDFHKAIDEITVYLQNRSVEIAQKTNPNMKENIDYIEGLIDRVTDNWSYKVDKFGDKLKYGSLSPMPTKADVGRLMKVYGTAPTETDTLETMTSMRSVDATVPGFIMLWEE